MCFKGEIVLKNKELFQRHQVECPDEDVHYRYNKTYSFFRLFYVQNQFPSKCECWIFYFCYLKIKFPFCRCNVNKFPMPSAIKSNEVTVFSYSTSSKPLKLDSSKLDSLKLEPTKVESLNLEPLILP